MSQRGDCHGTWVVVEHDSRNTGSVYFECPVCGQMWVEHWGLCTPTHPNLDAFFHKGHVVTGTNDCGCCGTWICLDCGKEGEW